MLRAATLWEERIPLDQLPSYFNDVYRSSEKLTKMPLLRGRRADTMRRPVLYVPGQCLEVRRDMAQGMILFFVLVGRLDGGHCLWRWRRQRGEGGREGGLEMGGCVVVWCEMMCDVV